MLCVQLHTSSLLTGTDSCRRFPTSNSFSFLSCSTLTTSSLHLAIFPSISVRTFLIWDTVRPCVKESMISTFSCCFFQGICVSKDPNKIFKNSCQDAQRSLISLPSFDSKDLEGPSRIFNFLARIFRDLQTFCSKDLVKIFHLRIFTRSLKDLYL